MFFGIFTSFPIKINKICRQICQDHGYSLSPQSTLPPNVVANSPGLMSSTPPTPRTVAFAIDISHSSGFQGEGYWEGCEGRHRNGLHMAPEHGGTPPAKGDSELGNRHVRVNVSFSGVYEFFRMYILNLKLPAKAPENRPKPPKRKGESILTTRFQGQTAC